MKIAAALVVTGGCGTGPATVDPLASVVSIEAAGCRPFPANAVGTVVGDGLVVTVAHAVAGEDDVVVRTADGRRLGAAVASIDIGLDVAVLRVDGADADALRVESYEEGDDVSLLGVADGEPIVRPVSVRRRVTIRTTDIYREGEHLRPGFELEARVRSGDSGGGMVDADGRLVGMVWAASRGTDDRAWAVTSEAITPLIEAARDDRPPPTATCSR